MRITKWRKVVRKTSNRWMIGSLNKEVFSRNKTFRWGRTKIGMVTNSKLCRKCLENGMDETDGWLAYPLGVSDCFATEKSTSDRFDLADSSVVDDQLWSAPINSGLRLLIGKTVVKDTVGFVRFIESIVDQRVGYLAQTSPSGPCRFARIVSHIQSSCWLVIPTFTSQSTDRWWWCLFIRCSSHLTIHTVGPAPSRRPDEQSKFTTRFVPALLLLLLLIAVLIRRKR